MRSRGGLRVPAGAAEEPAPHAASVCLGWRRTHRCRSHFRRRPRVQAARVDQCPEDADGHGRHSRHHLQRHYLSCQPHGDRAWCPRWSARPRNRCLADRPWGLRPDAAVLRRPVFDVSHPLSGCEYCLLRLSAPGVLSWPRQVSPPPIHVPR